jgi:N-acetyl-anhydromuramyl-L-alanine amidase AmpD
MPDTLMARHVIGLNHCAIGIENVGGTTDKPLTEKQLQANIELIKYLDDTYQFEYMIGHYEYTRFEGHPLWKEVDDGYRTVKTDPGEGFMRSLREALQSRGFRDLPGESDENM